MAEEAAEGRSYFDLTAESIRPRTAALSDTDLARLAVAALLDADPRGITGFEHVADLFVTITGESWPTIDGDEWRRVVAVLALQRFLP